MSISTLVRRGLTVIFLCSISVPPAPADDASDFHIASKPVQSVTGTLTFTLTGPQLKAAQWLAFVPEAPAYSGQTSPHTTLTLPDLPGASVTEVLDQSPRHRPVLRAAAAVPAPTVPSSLVIQAVYRATLVARDLVPGPPPSPPAPLSAAERQNSLAATYTVDFPSARFQRWLAGNRLTRHPGETDLTLGRRALQFLADHYDYQFTVDQDRRASSLCGVGATDCGGASVLFVAILRADGVPARVLAGRWAFSSVGDQDIHQWHVKSEFYADGVGWVPIEASEAISHKDVGACFGHDDGYLIVFHIDNDLALDPVHWPVYNYSFLQDPGYWATGWGTFDSASTTQTWQVTSAPAPDYTAASVSAGAAGASRVLWDQSDGTAALWKVDPSGRIVANVHYGPYAGWTAQALATGTDGGTRVLWTRNDGRTAFWLLDSHNNYVTQQQYGPYDGWTPISLAAEPDGTARVLWANTDGTATVWTLDSANRLTGQHQYGPYLGWTAKSLTVSPDGSERLLWDNADGTASFWRLDRNSQFLDQHQYGPYSGWAAQSLAAAPDGTGRAVWGNVDGHITLWTLDAQNNYTGQGQYGPYSGWNFQSLSVGSDGNARLLWDNVSGQSALWSLTPSGSLASNHQYGPY